MKYTVIVPVFNGEDTIEECLQTLLNQKGVVYNEDYTILVVDDGSSDNTVRIARKFPVEIVSLGKNEGRIIARLTGAKLAKTSRLLFVDSRISLPDHTVSTLNCFDGQAAIIGELNLEEKKYEAFFQTILYLIRRKYYGKEYFPLQTEELLITEHNFRRSPKGTAVLLIDRDLFLDLTPERTGKEVNDDTRLFHNLIFKRGLSLVRSKKLSFQYSQRTDFRQFSNWLFHRGVRFTDFYLRPGGYFFIPFLLSTIAGLVSTLAAIVVPNGLYYILGSVCTLNMALTLYLSENKKDFPRVFFGLPVVAALFASGIARYWIGKLKAFFTSAKVLPDQQKS